MSRTFDYVIIGGGCIGVSIAWHLAKSGAGSVALLEKEEFLGTQSTGKCAGGVRAQFSTEVNARLSLYSLDAFDRFEEETGHPLQFLKWGYLFLLTDAGVETSFRGYHSMWSGLGMDVEWLEPSAIAQRFGYVSLEGVRAATLHMRDGFVDPNDITQGYARAARECGVQIFTNCAVSGVTLDQSGRSVTSLQTSTGDFCAKQKVIIAAGAWSKVIGGMMGAEIPIQPYRRQILVTREFPQIPTPWPMTVDMGTGLYFHPESGGVLIGLADKDEPPSFNQAINEAFSETMLMTAMERCPPLEEAAIKTGWAGLYETTPDHHPVIDHIPALDNVFLCAGFSGHGLMHAPAAGMLSAELIRGLTPSINIENLSFARFSDPSKMLDEVNVI